MFPRPANPSRNSSRKSKNRTRTRATRRRSLFIESLEDRRVLASIAVFDNGAFVDTSNNFASESDNVQASLTMLGHAVSTFTAIDAPGISSALAGKDALLIPELETGDLNAVLTPAARTQISNFVSSGGDFVIHGQAGNRDENLINAVFGFSVAPGINATSGTSSITVAAVGTAFDGGPVAIPNNNGTYMWATSSLPALAKSIYATGTNTTVAQIPFGSGRITFLAYDWFDAAPVGTQNGGWLQVLNSAVNEFANTPPTANAGGPYTVAEGATVVLVGSGSDPDGDPLSYEWDFDYDGSTFDVNATGASVNFSAALLDGPTTQTVALRVSDGNGGTAIDTAIVEVQNVAPQLQNVTITPSIDENDFATLSGDIIDPGVLDAFTLVVDWGDGSAQQTYNLPAGSTSFSVTHQYLDDNPTATVSDTYTVKIDSFTDDDGGIALLFSSHQLLVNGSFETGDFTGWTTSGLATPYIRNPQVVAAGTTGYGFPATPTNGNFAVLAGFDGAGPGTMRIAQVVTLPSGVDSELTFDWRAAWSHSQLPRTLSVNVETVSGSPLDSFLIYTTTPPGSVDTGNQTSTVDLSAFAGQTVRVAIDQFIPQFFTGPAQMQIDNVSLVSTQNWFVTVNNVAPSIDPLVLSSAVIDENGSVTVNGTFTDPGTLDTHEVIIDWGDGSPTTSISLPVGARSFTATHQYLDDNPTGTPSDQYTIIATVTDDDMGAGSASATITVNNVAPVLTSVVSSADVICDSSADGDVSISGAFTDIGTLDTHIVMVDWGDGSPEEAVTVDQFSDTFSGSHLYATGGIFVVTVTAVDDDGGTSVNMTTTAVVQGVGVVDGTLYIIGTEGRDHVNLKFDEKKGELRVDVKLNQDDSEGGSEDGHVHIKQTFTTSSIDRIVAFLCGGDDHYNGDLGGGSGGGVAEMISQFVFGGAGNDHIRGGRGNDVLSGGSGDDIIQGGDGHDILIGGTGKDKLKGGDGHDLLIGGSAANEEDLSSLDAALADWVSGDLTAALFDLGTLTDDDEEDDLKGENGVDHLIGGLGDKLKQ